MGPMAEKQTKRTVFLEGFRDGIPIALGYFAVAFSLGIAARNAGLTRCASPRRGSTRFLR